MDDDAIDFALAVWREDGLWHVEPLPPRAAGSLENLTHALRQLPAEGGALGLVSVAEEFFVVLRILGAQTRLLLSDVTAARDWSLADEVLEQLGIPVPDEDDEILLAGDLKLFDDLGVGPQDLDLMCADVELYPDEVLSSIAARAGFGDQFDAALESLAQ